MTRYAQVAFESMSLVFVLVNRIGLTRLLLPCSELLANLIITLSSFLLFLSPYHVPELQCYLIQLIYTYPITHWVHTDESCRCFCIDKVTNVITEG